MSVLETPLTITGRAGDTFIYISIHQMTNTFSVISFRKGAIL